LEGETGEAGEEGEMGEREVERRAGRRVEWEALGAMGFVFFPRRVKTY
jgi:hypothetical protein